MSVVWILLDRYAYEGCEVISAHDSLDGAKRAADAYLNCDDPEDDTDRSWTDDPNVSTRQVSIVRTLEIQRRMVRPG